MEAGVGTIEKLGGMTPEQLEEIQGIGPEMVEQIQDAVNAYYSQFEEPARRAKPAEPEAEPEAPAAAEAGGRGRGGGSGRTGGSGRAGGAGAGRRSRRQRRPEAQPIRKSPETAGTVWYDRRRGFPHSQSAGRSGPEGAARG